jgi:hypothetical protein
MTHVPAGHPPHTCDRNPRDLEAAVDDVKSATYYVASASLVVAGDFDSKIVASDREAVHCFRGHVTRTIRASCE